LQSFAVVAVLGHNQQNPDQPIELTKIEQGKRIVHTLVGDKAFPPGVQPALSLVNGYLVVADSPETVRQFAEAVGKDRKRSESETVPLLRASLKDWRAYLKDRQKPLAGTIAEREKIAEKDASQKLDHVLGVLQFVDRLEISQRSTSGRTTLTLAVQTAYPLKK
jgi:hypothetical protein